MTMNLDPTLKPTDICPPFTAETAAIKVQMAENAWNSQDPVKVSLAYTENTEWRNRDQFLNGREAVQKFLREKWEREGGYRLKKELWSYSENRIAVRFEYEWHNSSGSWYRSYGNEMWEFADDGLMQRRFASINDVEIAESDRRL